MNRFYRTVVSKKTLPLIVVAVFIVAQAVVLIAPFTAQAAPAISTATTGTMLNVATKKQNDYNAGTGSGRVLIVVVASDDRTNRMSSVTYGNVPMTEQVSQLVGGTANGRVQVYTLTSEEGLPSGMNRVTFTATAADNYAYVIAYVTGAGVDPVGTINTNSASSGSSLSVSNVPQESDSLIIAGFASDSTTAFTPASGSSEIGEVSAGSGGVRAALYTKVAPSAGVSTTVGASGGSAAWAAGSIEIQLPIPVPDLDVTATDNQATEPSPEEQAVDTAEFTFSRSDGGGDPFDFAFYLDGTADGSYQDYHISTAESSCEEVTGDSARFPIDDPSCTIVLVPEEDEYSNEDTEYAGLQLMPGSDYNLGENDNALVYIVNYVPPDVGGQDAYTVADPGYETMSIYDDDIVPSGAVAGFTATPSRVQLGGTATLSWSVVGMTSCSINNGIGTVDATDGPHSVATGAISARTTFILSCTDTATTHDYSVVVGIVPSFIEQ